MLFTTWKCGRRSVYAATSEKAGALDVVNARVCDEQIPRVPGRAAFLSGTPGGAPAALPHNLKHSRVVHAPTVPATVRTRQVPVIAPADRVQIDALGHGFYRAGVRFSFTEDPYLAPAHGPPATLRMTTSPATNARSSAEGAPPARAAT